MDGISHPNNLQHRIEEEENASAALSVEDAFATSPAGERVANTYPNGQSSPATARLNHPTESKGRLNGRKTPLISSFPSANAGRGPANSGNGQHSISHPVFQSPFAVPPTNTSGRLPTSGINNVYDTQDFNLRGGNSPTNLHNGQSTPSTRDSGVDVTDLAASSPVLPTNGGQLRAAGLGLTGKRTLTPPYVPRVATYRPGPIDTRHAHEIDASQESIRGPLPTTPLPSVEEILQRHGEGQSAVRTIYRAPERYPGPQSTHATNQFPFGPGIPQYPPTVPGVLRNDCRGPETRLARPNPQVTNNSLPGYGVYKRRAPISGDNQNLYREPKTRSTHPVGSPSVTNDPLPGDIVFQRPASQLGRVQTASYELGSRCTTHGAPEIGNEPMLGPGSVDLYLDRADEIGLDHGLPGIGYIGYLLTPPDWKTGTKPISPRQAEFLFQAARTQARRWLQAPNEADPRLTAEQREGIIAEARRKWNQSLNADKFIRNERIKIYEDWIERDHRLHRSTDVVKHSDTISSQGDLVHMMARPPRRGDFMARSQKLDTPQASQTHGPTELETFHSLENMERFERSYSRQIALLDAEGFSYMKIPQQSYHGQSVRTDTLSENTYKRIKEFLRIGLELVEIQHNNWYREKGISRPPFDHHPACWHRGKVECVGHVCHVHKTGASKQPPDGRVHSNAGGNPQGRSKHQHSPAPDMSHLASSRDVSQAFQGANYPATLSGAAFSHDKPMQFNPFQSMASASQRGQARSGAPRFSMRVPQAGKYHSSQPQPQAGIAQASSLQSQQPEIYYHQSVPVLVNQPRADTPSHQTLHSRSTRPPNGARYPGMNQVHQHEAQVRQSQSISTQEDTVDGRAGKGPLEPETIAEICKLSGFALPTGGNTTEQESLGQKKFGTMQHWGTDEVVTRNPPTSNISQAAIQAGIDLSEYDKTLGKAGASLQEVITVKAPKQKPKKKGTERSRFMYTHRKFLKGREHLDLHRMYLRNDDSITEAERDIIKQLLVMDYGEQALDPSWRSTSWPGPAAEPEETDVTNENRLANQGGRSESRGKDIGESEQNTDAASGTVMVAKPTGEISSTNASRPDKENAVELTETSEAGSPEPGEDKPVGDWDAVADSGGKKTATPAENKRKVAEVTPRKSAKRARTSRSLCPRKS